MDRNKLAILANQLGGFDEVENILDIPADLVQKAISGESLTLYENAILENGINRIYLDSNILADIGIDASLIEQLTDDVNFTEQFISDINLSNEFREQLADGDFPIEYLDKAVSLFANLSTNQANIILSDEKAIDRTTYWIDIFEAYLADNEDISDITESEFWAWFRGMFYA